MHLLLFGYSDLMQVHFAVKDQMSESECRGHFLGGGYHSAAPSQNRFELNAKLKDLEP